MDEALALLRPAARGQVGVEHTSATLHALLFTGHAHALAGQPGRGAGRVRPLHRRGGAPPGAAVRRPRGELRRLGAAQPGRGRRRHSTSTARRWSWAAQGPAEVTIAALEDLAEQCLDAGDADGAAARLAQARALLHGDLVFGWRLELKHQLITGAAGAAAR